MRRSPLPTVLAIVMLFSVISDSRKMVSDRKEFVDASLCASEAVNEVTQGKKSRDPGFVYSHVVSNGTELIDEVFSVKHKGLGMYRKVEVCRPQKLGDVRVRPGAMHDGWVDTSSIVQGLEKLKSVKWRSRYFSGSDLPWHVVRKAMTRSRAKLKHPDAIDLGDGYFYITADGKSSKERMRMIRDIGQFVPTVLSVNGFVFSTKIVHFDNLDVGSATREYLMSNCVPGDLVITHWLLPSSLSFITWNNGSALVDKQCRGKSMTVTKAGDVPPARMYDNRLEDLQFDLRLRKGAVLFDVIVFGFCYPRVLRYAIFVATGLFQLSLRYYGTDAYNTAFLCFLLFMLIILVIHHADLSQLRALVARL